MSARVFGIFITRLTAPIRSAIFIVKVFYIPIKTLSIKYDSSDGGSDPSKDTQCNTFTGFDTRHIIGPVSGHTRSFIAKLRETLGPPQVA
jgi:hypothetical protein